ncbi:hypothetical protein ABBQ38_006138 [Trebouxia sp. C0009 RCD-2024]
MGQDGYWMLRFADPIQAHSEGTFTCGACEQAAIRDWDPIHEYHKRLDREARKEEGDEESDEGQADANDKFEASIGVADVDNLREHAATRQHILNMQFLRRAMKNTTAQTLKWLLKHTTQSFQDYHRKCYWIGGKFGFGRADEIVSLLQAIQLGNAGVGQVVARHEAFWKTPRPRDNWDCDSDDDYPSIAEGEEWYPFLKAAKKVPKPKCAACWGHHPLKLCCCCTEGITQTPSVFSSNTKLGTCPQKICRAAVQKTGRCQWTYSFEAECLLFAVPRLPHTAQSNLELCKGVVSDHVPDLPLGQLSEHAPEEVLVKLNKMTDDIKTRPAFADLFLKAEDKLAFIQRVKPYLWVGIEGGIRSTFCSGAAVESSLGMCPACWRLQMNSSS